MANPQDTTAPIDVVIVGGGLVGPALALGLARQGMRSVILDPTPREAARRSDFDGRAYAIALSSRRYLKHIDVWSAIEPEAEDIRQILVTDGRPGERASDHFLRFDSDEMGADGFGHMVEDHTLRLALLDAAEAGDLDGQQGLREAAFALLERDEARGALADFSEELLKLTELDGLPKDAATFPTYSPELAAAMREETRLFIQHVAFEGGDFSELFDADYTFVNDVMAAHYGIPGDFGAEFVRVDLPPEQKRGGILGHASVLSLLSHVTSTSPTLRGKFIRETVLCQVIPPPPPEVVTDLPAGEGGTMRERLEIHMSEPSCAACHAMMDPLGFGLESYDGIGAYRTLDNGFPIDDTADLDGSTFAGAQELGALLKENPASTTCLLRNLYRHGSGHLESPDEFDELALVSQTFAEDGYQLDLALADLVASPAFRFVGSPQ